MSESGLIRVEYDGRMVTLRQLAGLTGKPYHVLYHRIVTYGWPLERAVMCPVKEKNKSSLVGGPVSRALIMAGDEDWTVSLPLAITLMAILDCKKTLYRDDVRLFFCGGLFERLYPLDGRAVYERVMALVG